MEWDDKVIMMPISMSSNRTLTMRLARTIQIVTTVHQKTAAVIHAKCVFEISKSKAPAKKFKPQNLDNSQIYFTSSQMINVNRGKNFEQASFSQQFTPVICRKKTVNQTFHTVYARKL